MLRFEFMSGPWENSELPTIVRDSPTGSDPHILAVLKRVHNPAALRELCGLANEKTHIQRQLAEALKVIREQDEWHTERWEGCLEEAQQANAEGSQEAERQWMARANDHAKRMNVLAAFLDALKQAAPE